MEYSARKFNKETYDKYDSFIKEKMIKFLSKRNYEILKQHEDYNHDLVALKNNKKYYFELEVKIGYPFTSVEDYPFLTVSFLGRKKRLHNINPFYYLILCKNTGFIVGCHSTEIFKNEYLEGVSVNTRNRKGKDKMYRVPKEKCTFFKI